VFSRQKGQLSLSVLQTVTVGELKWLYYEIIYKPTDRCSFTCQTALTFCGCFFMEDARQINTRATSVHADVPIKSSPLNLLLIIQQFKLIL